MSTKSFTEVTNDTRTMLAGLKSHIDEVSKRGADASYIANLDGVLQRALLLDSQEAELQAQLKLKSAELVSQVDVLRKEYSDARKIVKMCVDQAGWKAFGIDDVR